MYFSPFISREVFSYWPYEIFSHIKSIKVETDLIRRFQMRQIGAFQSLKSDCTKLRHRRMSWVVSKGGISVISHVFSQFKKNQRPEFHNFHDFLRETERLRNLKKSAKTSGHYFSILNWSLNNIIYNILWSLSLVQSGFKAENREICEIRPKKTPYLSFLVLYSFAYTE